MSVPDFTAVELLEFARIHDFGDPLSELSKLEAVYLASLRDLPECPHCRVEYRPRPMHGTAWGVEHIHEPGCPDGDA